MEKLHLGEQPDKLSTAPNTKKEGMINPNNPHRFFNQTPETSSPRPKETSNPQDKTDSRAIVRADKAGPSQPTGIGDKSTLRYLIEKAYEVAYKSYKWIERFEKEHPRPTPAEVRKRDYAATIHIVALKQLARLGIRPDLLPKGPLDFRQRGGMNPGESDPRTQWINNRTRALLNHYAPYAGTPFRMTEQQAHQQASRECPIPSQQSSAQTSYFTPSGQTSDPTNRAIHSASVVPGMRRDPIDRSTHSASVVPGMRHNISDLRRRPPQPQPFTGLSSNNPWAQPQSSQVSYSSSAQYTQPQSRNPFVRLQPHQVSNNPFMQPHRTSDLTHTQDIQEEQRLEEQRNKNNGEAWVQKIRDEVEPKVRRGRNIAIIDCTIEGEGGSQWAASGRKVYSEVDLVPTNNPYFEATTPAYDEEPGSRNWDPECKLLNWKAKKLNPNRVRICYVSGTIVLYTEREPCSSCKGVISQFREMFPNINLQVIWWLEGSKRG
jgi:The  BURPS668_1122 family of deaminases